MSSAEWRCCVCNRVKDLRGDHLKEKTIVRSDCWPCAKKQTFKLIDPNAAPPIGAAESAPPFLFAAGQKQFSQPPPTAVTSKPSPFSAHNSNGSLQRSGSPSNAPQFSFGGNAKPGNPFLNPFATGGLASAGIAMQQTKSAPNPSPPFTFVARTSSTTQPPVFSLGAATASPMMTTSSTATGEECWRCSVCMKIKDLRGDHLKNKNIVRSDCWPCAKKQTFIRYDVEGRPLAVAAPSSKSVPQIVVVTPHSGRTSVSPVSGQTSNFLLGNFTSPREPQSTTDTLQTSSSFDAHATPIGCGQANHPIRSAFNWRDPEIPTESVEQAFFIAAGNKEANQGETSLTSAFYEKTIKYYLSLHRSKRFQRDMPLVWSDAGRTLYVCCTFLSSRLPSIEDALGEYASVLVYLESVCSDSISRIFCSDAFSFAAMSLYKLHLNNECTVYGPQKDMTTTASVLDSIVSLLSEGCAVVTSGEQRVEASKSIWQRTGLSVLPTAAIAEALRLHKSATDPASPNSRSGVDVVLIPRIVSMEEFAQFRNVIA